MTDKKNNKTNQAETDYLTYGKMFAGFLSALGVFLAISGFILSFILLGNYAEQYNRISFIPFIYTFYGFLSWLSLKFASVLLRLLIDIKKETHALNKKGNNHE